MKVTEKKSIRYEIDTREKSREREKGKIERENKSQQQVD